MTPDASEMLAVYFTKDELNILAGWLEGEIENLSEDDPGTPIRAPLLAACEKIDAAWRASLKKRPPARAP